MSGAADGAVREAAQRFLARHYRVMASAVNVGDWQAYIRVCAAAQENGSAWFDDEALAELLSVVADTTAGEAQTCRWHRNRCQTPTALCLVDCAPRSGGAQDDGLRARVEALARELEGYAQDRVFPATRDAYLDSANRLHRALAGLDDTQQDGH